MRYLLVFESYSVYSRNYIIPTKPLISFDPGLEPVLVLGFKSTKENLSLGLDNIYDADLLLLSPRQCRKSVETVYY